MNGFAEKNVLDRVEMTRRAFADFCNEHGEWTSPDGRVTEATAARLLDIKPKTLQNMRGLGNSPPYFKTARITFSLLDLAQWLHEREVR